MSGSAPLSLRLTPASLICWLVVVRNPRFCLLVRLSIRLVVVLCWGPRLRLILRYWLCLSVRFARLSIWVLRFTRLRCWNRLLVLFLSRSLMRCSSCQASWGFVRLQGFSPSDAPPFNTLVSSLSKCLAHQASISALHTAFVGLKRRQFYLSHLPAYFTDVNKRTMLAAPIVCADSLFLESDIARLLCDTQTSSSLLSQQALVDVASNRSGPRRRRFSPARSSPSCRRRRDSGSPLRSSKRVRFDSPAPSSALKHPNKGFRR